MVSRGTRPGTELPNFHLVKIFSPGGSKGNRLHYWMLFMFSRGLKQMDANEG